MEAGKDMVTVEILSTGISRGRNRSGDRVFYYKHQVTEMDESEAERLVVKGLVRIIDEDELRGREEVVIVEPTETEPTED